MTDYRALCAELVRIADAFDGGTALTSNQGQALDGYSALAAFRDVAARARAALAKQPVGATDEELLHVAAISIEPYESSGIATGEYEPETECAVEVYGSELIAYARAVLACWGNPAPQPVPVSERLPGPEDCDVEGRCWLWERDCGYSGCKWALVDRTWSLSQSDEDLSVYTHWLPAYALPLPEQEVNK